MGDRRMLTKKVTDDDNFLELSSASQALYLHLSMSADDDGFCNQVSTAMFRAHASISDLQALLDKRYIYQFENGVIVIKHWRMANALRKDRYTPTAFQAELAKLELKENGSYTWLEDTTDSANGRLPNGCQTVAEWLPQDKLSKDKLSKDNLSEDKNNKNSRSRSFVKPTIDEIREYCNARQNGVDAERFYDWYESCGWLVGKNKKMSDWKAAVRNWEHRNKATVEEMPF